MREIAKPCQLMFVLVLLFLAFETTPTVRAAEVSTMGPRTEDLVLFYYSDVEAAYAALKADEIDVVGYEITAELYQDAILDPNIVLSGVADTGFYEFDLNNNHTIHTYPGVENPFWYAPIRRAVAWCTDKDYIAEVICGGFAERIDAMIAAPAKDWANASYWFPNYPYEYDPAAASAHLDSEGWVEGSTPNPSYDAGIPGSTQFLRVYPPGHSKAGSNVDEMQWYIRIDDLCRNYAGHLVADAMELIGFQINRIEGDMLDLCSKVMREKDYHLYTGGWSVSFFPIYLHTIYHSQYWIEDVCSPNYVTGNNASNLPNYPEYDTLAEAVYYPESLEEAVDAAKRVTAYWVEECISVPLFSSLSYWASQTSVLGLVNMEGDGFENDYSFMNVYKQDGSAIRYGTKSEPNSMNPQFASSYYTYQNLNKFLSYAGVSGQPYDPGQAQAGWLQDWEVGTWDDSGTNKTYMRHWVRDDLYFTEAVTGNQLSNVNASDYFFSVWYTYADPTSWRFSDVQDVHHIDVHDDYSWTVYFNAESYWFYLAASPMLYSVDLWLQSPLATQSVENFSGFTGPGTVSLSGTPVWINEVTVDGTPLIFGADYNLYGNGGSSMGETGSGRSPPQGTKSPFGESSLEIITAQSGTLSVDYWQYGDSEGFTPGDLPWQDILSGSGMYYMTSFTPGVGGGASFVKNPCYWMETPPLGEIDFVWNFQAGSKPRNGYFGVNIYDVVQAAGAYGATATGVPSTKYISAADLAPVGGAINIYDIVTITGVYGTQWGAP